jgi:Ras-related protein Rab-18
VGEVGVGKSSIILKYVDDTFLDEEVGSIGADFKVKFLKSHKKNVKVCKP